MEQIGEGGIFERSIARTGDMLWRLLKPRPYFGVAMAAGTGLALATLLGATEIAIAAAAGYAAYQILKKDVPPSEALGEAIRLEREVVPA
jgi:hypothetical protein